MYYYKVFEEKLFNSDLGEYISFGIVVEEILKEKREKKVVCSISDVSVTKAVAEKIAALCNNVQLSPIHLNDVVYDTIE
ncbi:MAG: DUF6514 family protein [Oscillospiraceae bacterium]|nr:DUF6514 family protein [Oscillospiraceae bacterium]